jgi:hypothetical protein
MNKRIREVVRKLEEQAYVEHRQEYFCDNDDPTITSVSVTRHFDREKFAELIVRECLGVVDDAERGGSNEIWDNAVKFIRRDLQEHFGVEK